MPINTGSIVALVAGSSVLAAFVNQGLTIAREWWTKRRDASFSALYLAIALEAYAGECASRIADSQNYSNSGGHAGTPHRNVGDLPDYPASMEWKPFGIKDTTRALSFRVEVESTKAMISGMWEFGEEDDVVPLTREESARLGAKALTLAIGLRERWNLDPVEYSGDWNIRDYLNERQAHYEQLRRESEERNRQMNAEMFAELEVNQAKVAQAEKA